MTQAAIFPYRQLSGCGADLTKVRVNDALTPGAFSHPRYTYQMPQFPRRAAVLALAFAALAAIPAARADEDCSDVERNYELIKSEAVSVQINMTLFAAADRGCEALVRKLLDSGASLLARDRLGVMPLAYAARGGHVSLVGFFLDRGAPVDARNVAGSTALLAAVERRKNAVVKLLLARGANPNLAGRSGVTPLIAAAFKDSDRMVEELLARGADPKARDTTGKAAIVYAAARGSPDIVQSLLDAGVDAKERYANDLTALMWAAGHDENIDTRAIGQVIDILLARGATLDAADNRGRTALMIAAVQGDAATIDILLRRGADRGLKDKEGKTALDLAANDDVRAKLRQ